jgi:predicted Rossmann fold nucleotide-binding protein DprA/Smf involved in DNA uptake
MKIAIVGSRDYPHLDRVQNFVAALKKDCIIVSGGARGVDSTAEKAAKENGLEFILFLPDWDKNGKSAGFLRNIQIIEEADIIVAFWDGVSHGTLHSITEAVKRNKTVRIYGAQK